MNQRYNIPAILSLAIVLCFHVYGFPAAVQAEEPNGATKELQELKSNFGPVLKLEGNARKEINTIANLLAPESKLKPIDATNASGEMCMLETVSKHNMIHFSQTPDRTTEDVVYYINPATFIANGLDVAKLPRHPSTLGNMEPLQWYYYDGTYVEPHQGTQLNKEFVIMSVDVK